MKLYRKTYVNIFIDDIIYSVENSKKSKNTNFYIVQANLARSLMDFTIVRTIL